MNFKIASITLLLLSTTAFSQINENVAMEGDRPDQTESSALVPFKFFQLENGFVFEQINVNSSVISPYTFLLRYGLWENVELRLANAYSIERTSGLTDASGMSALKIGAKVHIREEQGILPKMALLAHFDLPNTGNIAFQNTQLNSYFSMAFSWTLSENIGLASNLGVGFSDSKPEYFYSLVLGYGPTEKLGLFIETYGYPIKGSNLDARMDGGITYKIIPSFQLDIAGGFGLTDNSIDYFYTIGLVWRLPK